MAGNVRAVPNIPKNSGGASNPFIQPLRKVDREEQLERPEVPKTSQGSRQTASSLSMFNESGDEGQGGVRYLSISPPRFRPEKLASSE
jgi:hypothetical protein